MSRTIFMLLGAALLPAVSVFALPNPPTNPADSNERPQGYMPYSTPASDRAQAVIDVFRTAWDGYHTYAFPHDELHPVTNGYSDSRNAWGASAVDALSTALVMGQKDIVNQILDHIATVDYTKTATEVSLFETTIRYLGGMISGYDFLTGPLKGVADKKSNIDALLSQSKSLANALSFAFETPTGLPYNTLDFTTRTNDGSPNGLATVGTLVLEWTRLGDLTGNLTYTRLTQTAESYLLNPKPASSSPWPGLLGTNINVTTGEFLDASGGWVGGDDSYYEYLIKMYVYDPERFASYRDAWIAAADSTIAHLTSHPSTQPNLTFVAAYDGHKLKLVSQHLACFGGGNFILGGQVLGQQKYIDYGLKLVDGCHDTYVKTATGIGPEVFGWDSKTVPKGQEAFFKEAGFYVLNPSYDLRPEVLESFYYAYRATGDPKYQDWAWEGFQAINRTTRVGSGYSNVNDVNVAGGGGYGDFQESFWFAEVLKYAYLIQADEQEWQVAKDGKNKWVFNTEAHPFKVARA
ncbi:mannosyl-oligosaccharide alpha-1,2-mannosidase-like protein [Clohesyomyces aquaticus]|uniref:alpha-1,2-Mannosidase n=1 Tax=Clohesyomyces aquaticus TaxID=1231657 RepID=A0A1Y1ZQK5_9PLEO|nr:mannosyl-oligosaccharide alpha-1,2-mannosidase-like protein [Clohesyomyces aquaticus]